jgi:DNA repair exonuclease SbcCD ATPase subunit
MRYTSLRLLGIGPYRGEVYVDFEQLSGPLIAVCGLNGGGKSTLLESLAAGAYRKTKTRGHIKALANNRNAFIEIGVAVEGERYLVRQTIDAHTGKGETLLSDADGRPLNESGKSSEAKKWIDRRFPDPLVYFASLFGAQKVGGLLAMDPAPRKKVIGRALGNVRLELLAKAAGKHVEIHDRAVREGYARLEEAVGADVGSLTVTFRRVGDALQQAEQRRSGADAALVAGRERAAAVQAARRAWQEHKTRRANVERRIGDLEAEAELTAKKLANNRNVQKRAPEIRAAEAKLAGLRDRKVEIDRDVQAIEQATAAAQAEQERVKRESGAAEERYHAAEERIARAQAVQATAAEVEKAGRDAKKTAKLLTALQRKREETEEKLRQARSTATTSQLQRITRLRRDGLEPIAQEVTELSPSQHAQKALGGDDELIAAAQAAPKLIEVAEAEERDIRQQVDGATRELAELRIKAARQSTIDQAHEDEVKATAERLTAGEEMAAAEVRMSELVEELPKYREQQDAARAEQAQINELVTPLQKDAKLMERLAAAEGRIAELVPAAERLAGEIATARAELAAIPVEPEPEPENLAPLQQAYSAAAAEVDALKKDLARAEAALQLAKMAAEREQELRQQIQVESQELADWKLLHAGLGRDGVPALELDAAGPELTELTNTFLRCRDSRFSLRIDSTRRTADGRDIEGCPIMVYDAQNGREGEAKTFSPGEQAFIGEALDLALSLYGIQRVGGESPTIIRDEPTSSLDPDNGRAYIEMLRKAAELTGAHRVLFVTHDRSLWPLADSRIHIADGQVSFD